MAIDSIGAIGSVGSLKPLQALEGLQKMTAPDEEKSEGASFSNFLTEAINKTLETEAIDETGMAALLAGEDIDISTAMAETTNAELALNLTIQLRNKVLDAYNEIMRMQV